jgi:hypothetical protein
VFQPVLTWLREPTVLIWFSVGLFTLGIVSLLVLPFLLARIPEDYFTTPLPHRTQSSAHWCGRVAKNLFGGLLLLLGLAMLVLPGQGLLTLLAALLLLDFPGKRRAELWLVQRPQVLRILNALRARGGRPPLRFTPPNIRHD